MTLLSRDEHRRSAVLHRRILVRASCKERGHHGPVAILNRVEQWRSAALLRRRIHVRASCKQLGHRGHVTNQGSDVKRCLPSPAAGPRTFGKAVIQTVSPLSDGSGIVVTTARYQTPQRTDINKKGIAVDMEKDCPISTEAAKCLPSKLV